MQFYLLCSDTYVDCISLTRHAIQHHLVVDTHIHVQEHTYWTALVFYLEHAAHAFQLLSPYLSLNSHSFPNNTFAVLQLSKPEPLQHPPLPVDTFVSLEVGGGEVTLVLAATHCNEQPVLLLAQRHTKFLFLHAVNVLYQKHVWVKAFCTAASAPPCLMPAFA